MSEQLASSTCDVCKGEQELTGVLIPLNAFTDEPGQPTKATIYCPNDCHQGRVPMPPSTVPAAGDLAAWREEAERIVQELATAIIAPPKPLDLGHLIIGGLTMILRHLAAMPAQDPNAELLKALKCYEMPGGHFVGCTGYDMCQPHCQKARAAIAQAEQGAAG